MSDWPTEEDCAAFYNAITDPTKTFWLGVAKQRQESRAAAFGAIRRAAEEARRLDCPCGCHGDSYAIYIRRAIRAAIGSPKA